MSKISKDPLYTNRLRMLIGETVDRVNLLNALEEHGLCLRCDYCNFLKKLKNILQENGFFTFNSSLTNWKIQYTKNNVLIAVPVLETKKIK